MLWLRNVINLNGAFETMAKQIVNCETGVNEAQNERRKSIIIIIMFEYLQRLKNMSIGLNKRL